MFFLEHCLRTMLGCLYGSVAIINLIIIHSCFAYGTVHSAGSLRHWVRPLIFIKQNPSEFKTRALIYCCKEISWTVLCLGFETSVGDSSYLQ